ncbi:MAG TPA: glycerate kinase [Gaiellaceae bacterium]
MPALASPASLKGVLSAREAAACLLVGFERAGAAAAALPIADGGEGTAEVLGARIARLVKVPDAFGRPREAPISKLPDGTAVIESASAIPLVPERLEVGLASSRGLGELIAAAGEVPRLLVCLGGTATMDAGEGLLAALERLPAPTTALYDVRAGFLAAPRLFGRQKGASERQLVELEERFAAAAPRLGAAAELPGSGAAGGLGAALASLGAELLAGAPFVLERLRFPERARQAELVVTGEGRVDSTTLEGKAPGEAAALCRSEGVRCVVFGGRIELELPGAELAELSGEPSRAREDLLELGERLGRGLSG